MQDMMSNFFEDMWKNVNDSSSLNIMNDFTPTTIGQQVLDFQKSAFNNSYNAIVEIQKQAEPLLKNNPAIPEEWISMLAKNQADIKKSIDESIEKAEAFFSTVGSPQKKSTPAAAAPNAKTEAKAK